MRKAASCELRAWYHLAILSLTKVRGAKSDPRWIARRLGITVNEASQAVARLVNLGLLQTRPQFLQIGNPFEVYSDIPSAAIRKYHKQILTLTIEKIDTVQNDLRELQSLSITIDPKKIKTLKNIKTLVFLLFFIKTLHDFSLFSLSKPFMTIFLLQFNFNH